VVARLLALLVALTVAAPAWAGSVYLALDASKIDAGQSVGLSVVIEEGRAMRPPKFDAPDGLVIEYAGSRTETRQVNFKFSTIQTYQYQILTSQPGTFSIGPVSVVLAGNQQVASNQVTLEVAPRQAESGRPKSVEVTASVEPNPAWEGQVVLYHYGVRSPNEILDVHVQGVTFDGLRQVTYADGSQRSFEIDDPSGPISAVDGDFPMVAVATGQRTQSAGVARVTRPSEVRGLGFGIRQDKTDAVVVPSITVDVRKLPPAPPGFSGLVGDFQIESSADTKGAAVGSSIPWRISLVGDGDVAGFTLPRPPDTDAVRYYEANSELRGSVADGTWRATATFDRSIVPVRPGTIDVPPLDLIVFSPKAGDYVHLLAKVDPFDVKPGREGSPTGLQSYAGSQPEVPNAPAGPSIRPLIRFGRDTAPALGLAVPIATLLAASPGAGVVVLAGIRAFGAAVERRREARRRPPSARDALAALPTDRAERLAALDGAIRLALAARLGAPVGELDRAAAVAALKPDLREQVGEITRRLDRARFAEDGGSDDLLADVTAVVDALSRHGRAA
jgi:hypothetical protein